MKLSNKRRSPLIAGFMAASLAIYSPAGHTALHEALLRIKFAPSWLQASFNVGDLMSFQTFREQAEIWAYDPDPNVYLNNIRLLTDRSSLCITLPRNEDAPNVPTDNFSACHAAAHRNDKKDKKNLALNKV